jgi:hypothetical protein
LPKFVNSLGIPLTQTSENGALATL